MRTTNDPSPFDLYHIGWLKDEQAEGTFLRAEVVDIDAPLDVAWKRVCDFDHYEDMTHGQAAAHIDGPVEVGTALDLQVAPHSCVGGVMGVSHETLSVVDKEHGVIAWTRKVPLSSGYTERYQVLVPISETQTRSFIGLKLPGFVGKATALFFGHTIVKTFDALQHGFQSDRHDHID